MSEKPPAKPRVDRKSKRYPGVRFRGKTWSYITDGEPNPTTGKRPKVWVSGFPTEQAAHLARCQAITERKEPARVEPSAEKVEAYLRYWLSQREHHLAPGSVNAYRVAIEFHLIPLFGHYRLCDLDARRIQEGVTQRQKAGKWTGCTLQRYFRVLHAALSQACRWRMLPHNPMAERAVTLPAREEVVVTPLSVEELLQVTEAINQHVYRAAFTLALYAGLRRGEVVGLRWCDIQWETEVLYVRGQRRRKLDGGKHGGDSWEWAPPKNPKTAKEQIPMLPELQAALRAERAKQAEWKARPNSRFRDQDWVVAHPNGDPYSPTTITQSWERLAGRLGLPKQNFHLCRHTLCVQLLRAKVPVQVVSRIMRHHSPAFTLTVYGHEIPGERADAAQTLHRVLQQARESSQEAPGISTEVSTAPKTG